MDKKLKTPIKNSKCIFFYVIKKRLLKIILYSIIICVNNSKLSFAPTSPLETSVVQQAWPTLQIPILSTLKL